MGAFQCLFSPTPSPPLPPSSPPLPLLHISSPPTSPSSPSTLLCLLPSPLGHWCDMHLSLQYGDTPLMVASREGHDGCVQLLLDRGAQVNYQNKASAFWDQTRIPSPPPHPPPTDSHASPLLLPSSPSSFCPLVCRGQNVSDVCAECWVCGTLLVI